MSLLLKMLVVLCTVLLFSFSALAGEAVSAASGAVDVSPILDFIVRLIPLLAALGLFHVGAAALRMAWAKLQIAAGNTPTKIDDFLVHLLNPAVQDLIALIDAGDLEAAKKKLAGLQALTVKK